MAANPQLQFRVKQIILDHFKSATKELKEYGAKFEDSEAFQAAMLMFYLLDVDTRLAWLSHYRSIDINFVRLQSLASSGAYDHEIEDTKKTEEQLAKIHEKILNNQKPPLNKKRSKKQIS